MAFVIQNSPGVVTTETALPNVVSAIGGSVGATVGPFQWGPVNLPTLISNENKLVSRFLGPNDDIAEYWFSASRFLAYSTAMYIVRVTDNLAANACDEPTSAANIDNEFEFNSISTTLSGAFYARYPGVAGNGLTTVYLDSTNYANAIAGDAGLARIFPVAPTGNNVHVAILDRLGTFTGTANAILEKWENYSSISTAKRSDGTSNYYKNAINNGSLYLFVGDETTIDTEVSGNFELGKVNLSGGAGDNTAVGITSSIIQSGWDIIATDDGLNIFYLVTGPLSASDYTYVLQNIAEVRQDCIAFGQVEKADVVNNAGNELIDVTSFINSIPNSTWGALNTGWGYMYDKYSDNYRWVPLGADHAGIHARNDQNQGIGFPAEGQENGVIKQVVKLAWDPSKAERDAIYPLRLNPIRTKAGFGAFVDGDRTLSSINEPRDRINVRKILIVIRRSIANDAENLLYKLNDEFTRNSFINSVEPFLANFQGQRWLYNPNGKAYFIKCDEENNDAAVIDNNRFVADIWLKPAASINFVQINFVAFGQSVQFDEIVIN